MSSSYKCTSYIVYTLTCVILLNRNQLIAVWRALTRCTYPQEGVRIFVHTDIRSHAILTGPDFRAHIKWQPRPFVHQSNYHPDVRAPLVWPPRMFVPGTQSLQSDVLKRAVHLPKADPATGRHRGQGHSDDEK